MGGGFRVLMSRIGYEGRKGLFISVFGINIGDYRPGKMIVCCITKHERIWMSDVEITVDLECTRIIGLPSGILR